jgi:hypothetical protein
MKSIESRIQSLIPKLEHVEKSVPSRPMKSFDKESKAILI